MRATYTTDELQVIDGFAEALRGLPDHAEAVDSGPVTVDYVAQSFRTLADGGWLGVVDPGAEPVIPLTTTVGLVERSSTTRMPLPLPLLEHWVAVMALDTVDRDLAAGYLTEGRTLSLCLQGLFGGEERLQWAPFGPLVDDLLVCLPRGDAVDVHLVRAADQKQEQLSELSSSLPIWSVDLSGVGDGSAVGRLDARDLRTVQALYLTFQAAEMVGSAQWLLDKTVEFLNTRKQFDQVLGSFQALQHRVADMLLYLETSRSLTYYAGYKLTESSDAVLDVALSAKGYAGEKCWDIGNEAIQMHGGIAYTWEGGIHYGATRIIGRALTGIGAHDCLARAGANAIDRGWLLR